MSGFRWISKSLIGAALIWAVSLAVDPARAQENPTPRDNDAKADKVLHKLAGKPVRHVLSTDRVEPATDQATVIYDELLSTIEPDGNALFLARVLNPADETLGATLQPVGDALRAQLDIPAGQGLVVASLRADSPCAQAGVKQNDILLTLAEKHLAAAEDLTKQLKAAGEAAVPLKILRAGKPLTIQVRPIYRVTLGPVDTPKTEYFIGVSVAPPDDALRAQLDLRGGQGVVVNEVIKDSPAEKAGVKKHDILLLLDSKWIDSPETLMRQVQAARDRRTIATILRGRKSVTIPITGAVRKVEAGPPQEPVGFWYLNRQTDRVAANLLYQSQNPQMKVRRLAGSENLEQRLDHLEKELTALHQAVDKLNELLKAGKLSKPD